MEKGLISIQNLVKAVSGRVVYMPVKEPVLTSVVIDSRHAGDSSLFIPLKGENTDGHYFLMDAVSHGARALIVDHGIWKNQKRQMLQQVKETGVAIIAVRDPLTALQDLSKAYLKKFPSLFRIGITGSNGKTTTKEIVGSILQKEGDTVINEGNLNSEIGLPLSVLKVEQDHRFGVFEMGMNHEGEMDILSNIVKPDAAIITNIGIAHIGILGSKDAIAREKKKICNHFNGSQIAFFYEDEKYFDFLSEGIHGKIIPYGPKSTKGFKGYEDLGLDGTSINWEGFQVLFPLFGFHNLLNALAALSLAQELGIRSSNIIEGLESVHPIFGRSQVLKGNITIIQDCYNSNPDSVQEVLKFLCSVTWKGRKIAVLGSMLELGEESHNAHMQVTQYAAGLGLDFLYLFGEEYETAYSSLVNGKNDSDVYWTDSFSSLVREIRNYIIKDDLLLLKGSRGIELERLIPEITKLNI